MRSVASNPFLQAEDGIREHCVTGVQTCALPISPNRGVRWSRPGPSVRNEGTDRSTRTAQDRKSTRLNSSHIVISYAVFCLKKKKTAYVTAFFGAVELRAGGYVYCNAN